MTDDSDIARRITDLKQRIDQAEELIKSRMTLHKNHQATINDLRKRHALLEQQLADEAASAEAKGAHLGSLEQTVLRWINSLTFDR